MPPKTDLPPPPITPQQIAGVLSSAASGIENILSKSPGKIGEIQRILCSFQARPTILKVLESAPTSQPTNTLPSHVIKDVRDIKTTLLALQKVISAGPQPSKPPSEPKTPKGRTAETLPKVSGQIISSFAKAAALPPRPSVVVSFSHSAWDGARPTSAELCDGINNALLAAHIEQVRISAARWTARENLILTGSPTTTAQNLQLAFPTIHQHLAESYPDSQDLPTPRTIRPNVKWSKILINSVPTGVLNLKPAKTPDECHTALIADNPTYASLHVTQRPSWVRNPTSYSDNTVSSLVMAFEDPDGSVARGLLAGKVLYIFGACATLRKWKQRPSPHRPQQTTNPDSPQPSPTLTPTELVPTSFFSLEIAPASIPTQVPSLTGPNTRSTQGVEEHYDITVKVSDSTESPNVQLDSEVLHRAHALRYFIYVPLSYNISLNAGRGLRASCIWKSHAVRGGVEKVRTHVLHRVEMDWQVRSIILVRWEKYSTMAEKIAYNITKPILTACNDYSHDSTDEFLNSCLMEIHSAVRSSIASHRDETLVYRFTPRDKFEKIVRRHSDFFPLVRKLAQGFKKDDVHALITHVTDESPVWNTSAESQYQAIEDSWTADFVNPSPLEGLREHIVEQLTKPSQPPVYGHLGWESRHLLDEFSKSYFLIPLNLRASTDRGYPPADAQYFLLALFIKTKEILRDMGRTKSDRIRKFRAYMSKDQSMRSTGKNRTAFYDSVILLAQQKSEKGGELKSAELAEALLELRTVLNSGEENPSNHCIYFGTNPESHISHTRGILRRQTGILLCFSSDPLFSFFLSTTGKITQFGQPRGQDASNRINDGTLATPRPYIHLGFDQLMQSQRILDRWKTLDHVVSPECVVHMGRPLWGTRYDHGDEEVRRSLLDFAVQKLLCGNLGNESLTNPQTYAVLSQRLVLDINTPHYLYNLESPFDAMRTMHEQIANHMRVCVVVGKGIESLRGIASSEPILSEAASFIMSSDHFDLAHALTLVLKGFSINQESQLQPFGEVFKKATMHFNHVLKPQAQRLLARRFLLYFMARGAAALGANCQPGFDAVYPYLYDSLDLEVKNVGFIIVQVKNDSNASRSDDASIFRKMDPFKCGLLGDSDKVDGRFPIPIIRLLFSLSGPGGVTQMTYNNPSEGTARLDDGHPLFTSYDYVCSGVSPKYLKPVEKSPDTWTALVNKPDQWSSFYNVPAQNVLRSQIPGCGDHEAHFSSWLGAVFE
ncbi:hypothetical protein BJY52DRAFT_1231070 [Lactarius psammicola]|nr:hypothetical protein BJY52DRAFT_1231070 [Lactarius psammicola]